MDYKTSESDGYEGAVNTLTDQSQENLRTLSSGNYDLYAAKLTLQTPLWGGNLTYGGEGSYTKNEQATDVAENDGIPGVNSSTNEVEQDLYAAFVSYNRSFGAFSGDIGLRYENVNSEYYENGRLVEEQSRRHQRLFPSFRLSYKCTADLQMELAYRNTVSRPAYSSLRSFIAYMGPYQYVTGNPLLQPTYTNSLTYMLKWKQFMLMGIYRKVTDYTAEISELYMGNSILNRVMNIDDAQFLTVALNYSSAFGIWRPNYDISVDKNYISFGNPEITYNKPVFRFNFRNGFSVNGWNFGIDISGNTKGHNALMYRDKFSWGTNVYVNTAFFNNQLLVGLQGEDVFNTRKDDYIMEYNRIRGYWENSMFRRTLMFSVTYRFNATQKRYKGSGSDELRRL